MNTGKKVFCWIVGHKYDEVYGSRLSKDGNIYLEVGRCARCWKVFNKEVKMRCNEQWTFVQVMCLALIILVFVCGLVCGLVGCERANNHSPQSHKDAHCGRIYIKQTDSYVNFCYYGGTYVQIYGKGHKNWEIISKYMECSSGTGAYIVNGNPVEFDDMADVSILENKEDFIVEYNKGV